MSKIIWSKLDPGFFSNKKIIQAGRNGREVYLLALCLNASRGATGSIPVSDFEPWYVADQLRITEAEALEGIERAVTAKLLALNGERVHLRGWDDDWARRALSRAEIQSNYRDRKEIGKESVTELPSVGNAVTAKSRVTDQRDQRDQRERNGNALSLDSSVSEKSRPPTAAAQPLSSTWEPAPETAATVRSLGVDYSHELAQFRLNAAARGHLFSDPNAAFEKFARGSRDIGKTPKAKPKTGSTTRTPKPLRTRGEDGTLFEDDDEGNPRPVRVGEGAPSAQSSETTAGGRHGKS